MYGPSFSDDDPRSYAFWEPDLRRRKQERLEKRRKEEEEASADIQIFEDEEARTGRHAATTAAIMSPAGDVITRAFMSNGSSVSSASSSVSDRRWTPTELSNRNGLFAYLHTPRL
jgi:hypothetical protein